jgi:hypothetical protein
MEIINPTLNIQPGNMSSMPYIPTESSSEVNVAINISKSDWDSRETSWNFKRDPLLNQGKALIADAMALLLLENSKRTQELKVIEENNNKMWIKTYGLGNVLDPSVKVEQISLFSNPSYVFGADKSPMELSQLEKELIIKNFISYAVGCMFGRFSIQENGISFASMNELTEDSFKIKDTNGFLPDDDNIIPVTSGDYFKDDIVFRLKAFISHCFGGNYLQENVSYIEVILGKSLKSYFLKDFYPDHLKTYKKRPIYWMFSSPNGSFNCLIYLHRYRKDTVSQILNKYLREFIEKVKSEKKRYEDIIISEDTSASNKTSANKSILSHDKIINELLLYEQETIYPLALEKIEINLDDGVLVNYNKFGSALKKVTGLSGKVKS